MDKISIKSNDFLVNISKKGAEIQSAVFNGLETNFLWKMDPQFWNRISPILFPIVGRLTHDSYTYKGQKFTMKQHGFARDCDFELIELTENRAMLSLNESDFSLSQYPFPFHLDVIYELNNSVLSTQWRVQNTGTEKMPFSIGGHPGFHLARPLNEYQLVFDEPLTADRHLIEGGFYTGQTEPCMQQSQQLKLSNELFSSDAVVFKQAPFKEVTLCTLEGEPVVKCSSQSFDYYGFWTKPGAPFLCIEPWAGLADSVNATGDLFDKEGIMVLEPGETKQFQFDLTFYPSKD